MRPAQRLQTILSAPQASHFTPHFLEQVSFDQVQVGLRRLDRRFGPITRIEASSEDEIWLVQSQKGHYQVLAQFDDADCLKALRIPTEHPTLLQARLPFVFLFFLPVLLVWGVIGCWTADTQVLWGMRMFPTLTLALALYAIGIWSRTSVWILPWLWLSLFFLIGSLSRLPILLFGEVGFWSLLGMLFLGTLPVPLFIQGIQGRRSPPNLVALGPVLSGGSFIVTQGGSTSLLNYHVAYSHMRYAVDWIGVGPLGFPARGLLPRDPKKYAIYGADVLAPLDGEVVAIQDGLPDLQVPQQHPFRPAGNHVVIRSSLVDGQEVQILLAHLRTNSLRVRPGSHVKQGDVIGQVGNSGNTSEPHLHVGVNVDAATGDPFSGEGVPFSVAGRFPVAGMIYRKH